MDGFEMVRRYRALESAHGTSNRSVDSLFAEFGSKSHSEPHAHQQSSATVFASVPPPPPVSARPRVRQPMTILGISANSDLIAQSLATDAGMDAFVSKPFTLADLSDVVARALSTSL